MMFNLGKASIGWPVLWCCFLDCVNRFFGVKENTSAQDGWENTKNWAMTIGETRPLAPYKLQLVIVIDRGDLLKGRSNIC
jgi:hypothetical protein